MSFHFRFIRSKEGDGKSQKNMVISMALVGGNANNSFGVIRNILLQPVYFPNWTVRVYLVNPEQVQTYYPPVPPNVHSKLKSLPVQLVHVNSDRTKMDPSLWPLFAIDDPSVDYVLVRKASGRLSERDALVVTDWLKSDKALHVVKDHPSHSNSSIVPGLWGIKTKPVWSQLQFHSSPLSTSASGGDEYHFLNNILWPKLRDKALVHNSVYCSNDTMPFPIRRTPGEYLGQDFSACGERTFENLAAVPECVKT